MAKALLRIGQHLKTLGKFQIFGLFMFSLGGIYVAALITIPRLLAIATRLL
jgi:hypothetical protein